MNYELVKQLKDMGFLQEGKGNVVIYPTGKLMTDNDFAYIPTLSELIDVCGEGFQQLNKMNNEWWCIGNNKIGAFESSGSTPEEAVANLWLKLNEKKGN